MGRHLVHRLLLARGQPLVNLDLLTYAGQGAQSFHGSRPYRLVRGDVADPAMVTAVFAELRPELVVHLAAESHVTRSEHDAARFYRTNVEGTRVMLGAAAKSGVVRFLHVSTDEVYGPTLGEPFREEDKEPGPGRATSEYARSKAVADDLATSFRDDLEVVVVRPTNCFGSWQYPEKAFARWVTRAFSGKPLLVWGDGLHIRQWLDAEDLVSAILLLLEVSDPDPVYNVGPDHNPEITNLRLATWIVDYLGLPPERVVLTDYERPQHDRRYAVDASRLKALGWRPGDAWERFAQTVEWYRREEAWWRPLVPEAERIYHDQPPPPPPRASGVLPETGRA